MNPVPGLADPAPLVERRTPAELQTYRGRYEAKMSHLAIDVADGNLLVTVTPQGGFPYKESPPSPAPPPMHMAFIGADRLMMLDGPQKGGRVEVIRDGAGNVAWLRMGGRVHKRL